MSYSIKFRAWDKKGKFMIPGGDLVFQQEKWIDHEEMQLLSRRTRFDIRAEFFRDLWKKYEIMQYVGLLDKNKKEGCRLDIVKYFDDSNTAQIGIIKDREYLSFYIEAVGGDEEGNQDGELHPDIKFEIIGNTCEHGHLLEEA